MFHCICLSAHCLLGITNVTQLIFVTYPVLVALVCINVSDIEFNLLLTTQ